MVWQHPLLLNVMWDVITILLFLLIVDGVGKVEWTVGRKI